VIANSAYVFNNSDRIQKKNHIFLLTNELKVMERGCYGYKLAVSVIINVKILKQHRMLHYLSIG